MEMAQSRIRDEPTPLRSVREDLPAWLGQVLDISLSREPGRRFQTALLFREALRRGLAHLPIEAPGPAPTPPELIATAAPRSMPILSPGGDAVAIEIPRATPPPAADMPTVATSMPAASVPEPMPAVSNTPVRRGSLMLAGVVVLLLVGALGVFLKMRGPSTAVSDDAVAAPQASSGTDPAPSDAPAAPAPAQPLSNTVTATPLSGSAGQPSPVNVPAPAVGSVAATGAGASPVVNRAGAAGAASLPNADPTARGRGRAVAAGSPADAPVVFPDLRAFVVTGKKAEEAAAVLRFQGGAVTLADDKGARVFAAMLYRDITSAAFVRAKNPRWYPTLAAPPSGVDMPGGLFRSTRAWLALQSRDTYLIVRLNDDDVRRVLDAVTERTGLKVEQLPPQ
jgi:hypothetical protein